MSADAILDAELEDYAERKGRFLASEAKLYKGISAMAFSQEMQRWKEATYSEYLGYTDAADTLLSSVEARVRVDTRRYWNRRQIAKHCNLAVDDRRLLHRDNTTRSTVKPSWTDLIKLTATLSNFKTKGFISKKQVKNIDKLEHALKSCSFNSIELRRITEALATKLGEEIEAHTLAADLTNHERLILQMLPDLENMEQLHEAALLNGDMEVAEEIGYNQLALHEKVLDIICEQYPIIRQRQEDAREFRRRRRWAIFRMANRDVHSVSQMKERQKEACEDDKYRIQFQLDNYGRDDSTLQRRFENDKTESDKYLLDIKTKQSETWKYIGYLVSELDKAQSRLTELSQERVKEINRRLELNEREEARRSGHTEFLQHATEYLEDLTYTIDSALRSKEVCEQLNEFILDGCNNVAAKFDRTEATLTEMELKIHKQHLKEFTNYYLAVGRLLYRKKMRMKKLSDQSTEAHMRLEETHDTLDPMAKKYSNSLKRLKTDQDTLDRQIQHLQSKLHFASSHFELAGASLEASGVHYVHPEKILEKVEHDRKSKVLDYREVVCDTQAKLEGEITDETVIIAKERELRQFKLQTTRTALAQQRLRGTTDGLSPKLKTTVASARTPKYSSGAFQRYQQLCNDMKLDSDSTKYQSGHGNQQSGGSGLLPPIHQHKPHPPSGDPPHSAANSMRSQATDAATAKSHKVITKLPKRPEGRVVIALYTYRAHNSDELSFTKGDKIVVVNQANEEGWMHGVCNQRTGLFPTNYVHLDPDDD